MPVPSQDIERSCMCVRNPHSHKNNSNYPHWRKWLILSIWTYMIRIIHPDINYSYYPSRHRLPIIILIMVVQVNVDDEFVLRPVV
jgi:hypothetical protein